MQTNKASKMYYPSRGLAQCVAVLFPPFVLLKRRSFIQTFIISNRLIRNLTMRTNSRYAFVFSKSRVGKDKIEISCIGKKNKPFFVNSYSRFHKRNQNPKTHSNSQIKKKKNKTPFPSIYAS
jgi:hypothetical protein